MKGLRLDIYRPRRGGAANGGISDHVDEVTVVNNGVEEVFEADGDAPAVVLVEDAYGLKAVPADEKGEPAIVPAGSVGWQFGGTFIYTSDARMPTGSKSVRRSPIPLHDRSETQEQYDALSQ